MDTQKRAEPSDKDYVKWESGKAHLLDEIEGTIQQLQPIKEAKKKEIKRHVKLDELPEQDQFAKLCSSRRTLLNTITMIACRAETAMCLLFEPYNYPLSKVRSLMQDLFVRSGDLVPDYSKKQLNIYLHSAATPAENRRIEQLLEQLNETETVFPNTDLKMVFHSRAQKPQGTFEFPPDQEV